MKAGSVSCASRSRRRVSQADGVQLTTSGHHVVRKVNGVVAEDRDAVTAEAQVDLDGVGPGGGGEGDALAAVLGGVERAGAVGDDLGHGGGAPASTSSVSVTDTVPGAGHRRDVVAGRRRAGRGTGSGPCSRPRRSGPPPPQPGLPSPRSSSRHTSAATYPGVRRRRLQGAGSGWGGTRGWTMATASRPQRTPRAQPPTRSRGRWTPTYRRATPTSTAADRQRHPQAGPAPAGHDRQGGGDGGVRRGEAAVGGEVLAQDHLGDEARRSGPVDRRLHGRAGQPGGQPGEEPGRGDPRACGPGRRRR